MFSNCVNFTLRYLRVKLSTPRPSPVRTALTSSYPYKLPRVNSGDKTTVPQRPIKFPQNFSERPRPVQVAPGNSNLPGFPRWTTMHRAPGADTGKGRRRGGASDELGRGSMWADWRQPRHPWPPPATPRPTLPQPPQPAAAALRPGLRRGGAGQGRGLGSTRPRPTLRSDADINEAPIKIFRSPLRDCVVIKTG